MEFVNSNTDSGTAITNDAFLSDDGRLENDGHQIDPINHLNNVKNNDPSADIISDENYDLNVVSLKETLTSANNIDNFAKSIDFNDGDLCDVEMIEKKSSQSHQNHPMIIKDYPVEFSEENKSNYALEEENQHIMEVDVDQSIELDDVMHSDEINNKHECVPTSDNEVLLVNKFIYEQEKTIESSTSTSGPILVHEKKCETQSIANSEIESSTLISVLNETEIVSVGTVEGSKDSESFKEDNLSKQQQNDFKQNALLKKLLQNCPSADLKNTNQEITEEQIKESESDNDLAPKAFANIDASQSADQVFLQDLSPSPLSSLVIKPTTKDESQAIEKMSDSNFQASDRNETDKIAKTPNSPQPVPEKKLSYLDIRRAQLEREPTPPLEEIKPKRKRAIKRKESSKTASLNGETLPSESNQIFNKTKKRSRKSSQNLKNDGDSSSTTDLNTLDNTEKLLNSIQNHLRSLPEIKIIEPEVHSNINLCLQDSNESNNSFNNNLNSLLQEQKSRLRGCYGDALLPSSIDYYATYPFGSNKPSVIPSSGCCVNGFNNSNRQKVGYYNEEFGDHLQEFKIQSNKKSPPLMIPKRNGINPPYSLYCRDIDSPETVISASSPESLICDDPDDIYDRMKYINDLDDSADSNDEEIDKSNDDFRQSLLFTYLPTVSSLHSAENNKKKCEFKENDKENMSTDERKKAKLLRFNSSGLLKESNNVGVTLTINSIQNVKNALRTLIRLLNLQSPMTYCVENLSEIGPKKIEAVIGINSDAEIYCKFCNCAIRNNHGFKAEDLNPIDILLDQDDLFCNKECFKNYALNNVNNLMPKKFNSFRQLIDDNESIALQQINKTSSEKNFSLSNKNKENDSEDYEAIINVHEKHWKNTRYLYWTQNSFKDENDDCLLIENQSSKTDQHHLCLKIESGIKDTRKCIFCGETGDGNIDGPSRLLNMDDDKWAHLNCALWSNEVYEMCNGALMNVDQAYQRAMNSVCARCKKPGASIKCFKIRCNNSFHFPCAILEKCIFYIDKTLFCSLHCSKGPMSNAEEMNSFVVQRRVYINRDEQKQIASMLNQRDDSLLRIGSLTLLNIGQLSLQPEFHTNTYIYPVGYKVSRFYWSSRHFGKRCQYICSIDEDDEKKPKFSVEIIENGYEREVFFANTPKGAWEKIIHSIIKIRENTQTIKVFFDFITGEDLFGLNESPIIRILESLPGVEQLADYSFKYGKSPWYELPLAINFSGCARTEPRKRYHLKRPHTLHVSSNTIRSSLQSPLNNSESSSPYIKQFVHSKVSQYKKMKQEWRHNVYLGRSRIQGIGLYATRDIEKHTMIIEYIGLVIRNIIADRNEKIHEAHNRGIYMFRLDDNRIIDATLQGGLARYINHSCDPNCVAECVQIDRENKILIIANRRIEQGEELTYDYKFDVEDDQHKIPCLCGAANCRKWMN
ncbi:mannose-P-dolichol utilization defect 1 protein [Sarcoptes scabiei]|nr:mannose-P-dolichol utilization defect 1 protein [Sarcoptes scabiei]